jgi:hypothetical protein
MRLCTNTPLTHISTNPMVQSCALPQFCTLFCYTRPVLAVARSKAWLCGRCLTEIAGSNPVGGLNVSCECCVLSGRDLCDGLTTHPGESYRVFVIQCDCGVWTKRRPWAHYGLSRHETKIDVLRLRVCTALTALQQYT